MRSTRFQLGILVPTQHLFAEDRLECRSAPHVCQSLRSIDAFSVFCPNLNVYLSDPLEVFKNVVSASFYYCTLSVIVRFHCHTEGLRQPCDCVTLNRFCSVIGNVSPPPSPSVPASKRKFKCERKSFKNERSSAFQRDSNKFCRTQLNLCNRTQMFVLFGRSVTQACKFQIDLVFALNISWFPSDKAEVNTRHQNILQGTCGDSKVVRFAIF